MDRPMLPRATQTAKCGWRRTEPVNVGTADPDGAVELGDVGAEVVRERPVAQTRHFRREHVDALDEGAERSGACAPLRRRGPLVDVPHLHAECLRLRSGRLRVVGLDLHLQRASRARVV